MAGLKMSRASGRTGRSAREAQWEEGVAKTRSAFYRRILSIWTKLWFVIAWSERRILPAPLV